MKFLAQLSIRTFVLFLLSGLSLVKAGGADASADLYLRLEQIDSLSANFEQRIKDHEGYVIQEVKGSLKLSRPDKVYWETKPPYEQLVVSNGDQIWIYDPDLEQVTIQSSSGALDGPLALLSESLEQLQSNYLVKSTLRAQDAEYRLKPKQSSKDVSFSELTFIFSESGLREIQIFDKLRQTTLIDLSAVQTNIDIPSATYQFDAPPGVDIVVNER